jgi:hypothetical protein
MTAKPAFEMLVTSGGRYERDPNTNTIELADDRVKVAMIGPGGEN